MIELYKILTGKFNSAVTSNYTVIIIKITKLVSVFKKKLLIGHC